MKEKLKNLIISVCTIVILIIDYFIAVFIAIKLNIYKLDIASSFYVYSSITWEIFIFVVLIVIEFLIVNEIYIRKNNKSQ